MFDNDDDQAVINIIACNSCFEVVTRAVVSLNGIEITDVSHEY